ncbi:Endoglucanase 3 [Hordeum vulgare]|nr:Endoglucanase 3 [Hordeum vulgare]
MRAAQAALAEMGALKGEECARQEKRVKDLLDAANEQHAHLDPTRAFSVSPGLDTEGVHEVQAIQYFIDGCRDGTLLKHKLMCSEPTYLAVLMAKADKYATADSAMRIKVSVTNKPVQPPTAAKPARDNRGRQNNKGKADQLDPRPGSKHVANMEEDQPSAQAGAQQQRNEKSAS